MKIGFLLVFILFVLGGCNHKNIIKSQSVKVVFKSKDLKIADMGFLNLGDSYESLQVFSLSKVILEIQSDDESICINKTCLDPKYFNKKFLSQNYKDSFMSNILRFSPIFESKNISKNRNGFEQKFGSIVYKVDQKSLYFKDKKEKIFIRIDIL